MAERAATARRNASIEPASGTQAETAGVEKTDVIDVTDNGDDYPSETRVKVEEESNDEASENGSEDGADPYGDLESELVQDTDVEFNDEELLRDTFTTIGPGKSSLRRRRPPQRYIPQLNAGGKQSYGYNGTVHLSYRGNRYLMSPKEGIVCVNLEGKPGVDNDPGMQYIDRVLNLNLAGQASEELTHMCEED